MPFGGTGVAGARSREGEKNRMEIGRRADREAGGKRVAMKPFQISLSEFQMYLSSGSFRSMYHSFRLGGGYWTRQEAHENRCSPGKPTQVGG